MTTRNPRVLGRMLKLCVCLALLGLGTSCSTTGSNKTAASGASQVNAQHTISRTKSTPMDGPSPEESRAAELERNAAKLYRQVLRLNEQNEYLYQTNAVLRRKLESLAATTTPVSSE